MAINSNHIIEEIDGVRCSVVEKNVTEERAQFLRKILEVNQMDVKVVKVENAGLTIGVTQLIFNPTHSIYNRSLKTPEGKILTPAYWFQKKQENEYYWSYK
ncbi:MAG: hypothetical protein HC905_22995 [Bacteroidales bacterium]|nr:hypothetical protein [Bacteroidales bacterium]